MSLTLIPEWWPYSGMYSRSQCASQHWKLLLIVWAPHDSFTHFRSVDLHISYTQAITSQWVWSVDLPLLSVLSQLLDWASRAIFRSWRRNKESNLSVFSSLFFKLWSFSPCIKRATTEHEKRLHSAQLQPEKAAVVGSQSDSQWPLPKKVRFLR